MYMEYISKKAGGYSPVLLSCFIINTFTAIVDLSRFKIHA